MVVHLVNRAGDEFFVLEDAAAVKRFIALQTKVCFGIAYPDCGYSVIDSSPAKDTITHKHLDRLEETLTKEKINKVLYPFLDRFGVDKDGAGAITPNYGD